MNAATITLLATLAADVEAIDPDAQITKVELGEMGDGSGRHFALVHTYEQGIDCEQTFRVATAAPEGAPGWARRQYPWVSFEVRTGDSSWLEIA